MKLPNFTHSVGTIGVNKGLSLFTPSKPLTIQINRIREDGTIYAKLYFGDELLISADLEYCKKQINKMYETLSNSNEATNA